MNPQALSQNPHRRASKSLPSLSPKESCCGPAVQEEALRSLLAALHNRVLCPLLPPLSHEQYPRPQCQLQCSHDPYLPLYLPPPRLNQDLYLSLLQPSMDQQTTRDRRQHHEHHLHPHPLRLHLPRQRNPHLRHSTTLLVSQLVNLVCARMRSSSSRRRKTTVRPRTLLICPSSY